MTSSVLPLELLEKFRRIGIRLDREGRFWHEGAEITHPGLRRALLRWLDVRPEDGRPILRLDETRYAYVDVDDAPLLVLSARWQDGRAFVSLNDDTEEELDYASLRVGAGDAMYCQARAGALEARITTPAYYTLAENIEQTDTGFALRAGERVFAIGERERQNEASTA